MSIEYNIYMVIYNIQYIYDYFEPYLIINYNIYNIYIWLLYTINIWLCNWFIVLYIICYFCILFIIKTIKFNNNFRLCWLTGLTVLF